jgi:hypothetical protein
MRATIDGILSSADLRHLTRYNEICSRSFSVFIEHSLMIVNGTKNPVDRSAPNTSGKRGVRFGLYHLAYSSTHSKKSFWERACVSSRIH